MSSHSPATLPTGPVRVIPGADTKPDPRAEPEKAEQKEVAGRHKNDGQMPHKGAR